nr:putative reverse transcriptase domain-containing protein [Tanacetum cinerariifolium]
MPPRRLKRRDVERLVSRRVVEAIIEYERNRPNPEGAGGLHYAGGTRPANARGANAPKVLGCSYKTFLNCKPHSFNGTEGVVGLSRWFEKTKSVFEISKCAEEDKRDLKSMMTTKYCLGIEIQKIDQELWMLTLKGDVIKGYNNCFHELALMFLDLVTPERKKIKHYVQGLPERVKANVTSSKPENLHETINMARELIEQGIQAKAARIGKATKENRKITKGTTTKIATSTPTSSSRTLGAEKSFVSTAFTLFIDTTPAVLDTSYDVELADGKTDEKKLEDIPMVHDSPKVFPDDLSGLPPMREVEFCIDLILKALPADSAWTFQVHGYAVGLTNAPAIFIDLMNRVCYYQRFIENFSKIAKPLTLLTQNNKKYKWGDKQEESFRILKEKLCNAPVLALLDGPNDFVVYCDASN